MAPRADDLDDGPAHVSPPTGPHAADDGGGAQGAEDRPMAKASRGGRMTAAKKRAAKSAGGKGPVKSRPAGKRIMST